MRLYNGVRLVDRPSPSNVRRIDMGALPMIDAMHSHGIRVDTAHLRKLSIRLRILMDEKEIEVADQLPPGYNFNISSPKHVADLLFHKLRIQGNKPVKLTDSQSWEATGSEVLQRYWTAHPVVPIILKWREYAKIKNTYADTLPRVMDANQRIHTRFKATTTTTGRLASEDPNLQNLPKKSALGREIRKAFIAEPGWVLSAIDLSQIEMRVLAHLSGEPSMVTGYHTPGWDMHTQTACTVFNLPESVVNTPEGKLKYRLPSKNIGFGVAYRIGPDGLQVTIIESYAVDDIYEVDGIPTYEIWSTSRCEKLIKGFYAARPYIAKWQGLQDLRVRRHGCVWTMFGRHRLIPQGKSTLSWVRNAGFREGANQPVQGSAQDILKLAMAEIEDRRASFNHKKTVAVTRGKREMAHRDGEVVRPLLQIHDELMFECKGEQVAKDWVLGVCQPIMEGQVPLDVPIKASADMGERWGSMEDMAA